jgi:hypothetical protein
MQGVVHAASPAVETLAAQFGSGRKIAVEDQVADRIGGDGGRGHVGGWFLRASRQVNAVPTGRSALVVPKSSQGLREDKPAREVKLERPFR